MSLECCVEEDPEAESKLSRREDHDQWQYLPWTRNGRIMATCHTCTISELHTDSESSGPRDAGWNLVMESFEYQAEESGLYFLEFCGFFFFFFFRSFCLFSRAAPTVYGGSQARGLIGAIAAGLRLSHSNAGSEPDRRPTPQLPAMLDP